MAGFTFSDSSGYRLPIFLTGTADTSLWEMSKATDNNYCFELPAAAATVHLSQSELAGRKHILFVYNGAVPTAPTRSGATAGVALFPPLQPLGNSGEL